MALLLVAALAVPAANTAAASGGVSTQVAAEGACAPGLLWPSEGLYLSTGVCAIAPPPTRATPAAIVGPDGVYRTLFRTANISYGGVDPRLRLNVDLREWDNIWGYAAYNTPLTPWPGVGGASPVIWYFPTLGYTASHFRTPANVAAYTGQFTHPEFAGGVRAAVTMSISTIPGDFSKGLPTAGCLRTAEASGANLVLWKGTPNAPTSWCNLLPNTDYWVNMIVTEPEAVTVPTILLATVRFQ